MGLLDGVLGSVLGGGQQGQGGAMDPKTMLMMGAMAMLAKNTLGGGAQDASQGGGLAGMLGGLLGGAGGQQAGGAGLAGMLGGLLGGAGGQQAGAGGLGALGGLLGAAGGVEGIAKLFQGAGMGDHVNSWIGNGENMPISADQVQQALGASGHLEQLANAAGVSTTEAAGHLADILPQLINQVTPGGQAPAGGLDIASLLQQVMGKQA